MKCLEPLNKPCAFVSVSFSYVRAALTLKLGYQTSAVAAVLCFEYVRAAVRNSKLARTGFT
jgi:hypothetical protein